MFEKLIGTPPKIPYDVRFVFGVDDDEDTITVLAHKFVLSLGSEVFKRQFYGPMKESNSDISIVDADPEVFSLFISCFYKDVEISDKSVSYLIELFYIAEKYDVTEMKEAVVETLTGDPNAEDDPMIAADAAALAHANKILPELSDALYMKSVRYILLTLGSDSENLTSFFVHNSSDITEELSEIIDDVKKKMQIVTSCRNCHRIPDDCLNLQSVTRDNFISGAIVKLSEVRYSLSGGSGTVSLGNPAVHKLGALNNDDLTFSSFSKSGLPLQISKLHSSSFLYDCSQC